MHELTAVVAGVSPAKNSHRSCLPRRRLTRRRVRCCAAKSIFSLNLLIGRWALATAEPVHGGGGLDVERWAFLIDPACVFIKNYDRPESLGPAPFYHKRRLDYPFDSRSHECARPKPKPCRSARPRRRQDRAALSQGRGGALFHPRRRGRGRTRRRTSHGRPGRCDPHPFRRVAHDHGYRAATLSLLLRRLMRTRIRIWNNRGRRFRPTARKKHEAKKCKK
jgi:hypothetical protein